MPSTGRAFPNRPVVVRDDTFSAAHETFVINAEAMEEQQTIHCDLKLVRDSVAFDDQLYDWAWGRRKEACDELELGR